MRNIGTVLKGLIFGLLMLGLAPSVTQAADPNAPKVVNKPWHAPSGTTLSLWPKGVPGGGSTKSQPREYSRTAINPKRFAGKPVTGVFNVSQPQLTLIKSSRAGHRAAVIVFPGGGFKQLAIDLEGTEACNWLNSLSISCVLVKYRVPDGDHHYDERCDCGVTPKRLTALEDAQRAIRIVRFHAAEWGIDPHKIGVLGFSAGGYLVAQTSNITRPIYPPSDPIDRVSGRPDAALALYPGHLCRDGRTLESSIQVTRQTPPTFIGQAKDDPTDPVCNSIVYARALRVAGVPADVHNFRKRRARLRLPLNRETRFSMASACRGLASTFGLGGLAQRSRSQGGAHLNPQTDPSPKSCRPVPGSWRPALPDSGLTPRCAAHI